MTIVKTCCLILRSCYMKVKYLLFLGVVVLCACLGLSCVSATDHNLTSDVNLTSDNVNITHVNNSTSDVNLTSDNVNTTDIVNSTTDVNLTSVNLTSDVNITIDDVNTTDIVNATSVNTTDIDRTELLLDAAHLGMIIGAGGGLL